MRACKEGTIECVSAVKEVIRRIMTIIVSMLSLSGKEQGPREEL
jgi:ERO1-like protein beta